MNNWLRNLVRSWLEIKDSTSQDVVVDENIIDLTARRVAMYNSYTHKEKLRSISEEVSVYVRSEAFLDKIVKRIRDKQI